MKEVALLARKAAAGPGRGDAGSRNPRYWAFLSYSHKDSPTADWLHGALEQYQVPRSLVGKRTATGIVPAGFSPIFRDRHELAASGDLGHTIREALADSRCLIVLCSPDAARSRWTNEEITAFKKLHPAGCVLAAIVAGEPFASEMPGREAEECFPPALRQKFDSRGRPTAKRAEPIAADLRETGDGKHLGLLKIVAGMLGLGLDDLIQRDQQRRQKRLTYIAAASLAGMVMTSGLAVFAFDKRDEARDQRREAEGLVGFMLGDLRQKLEPIGRLDALDAVGSRAIQYFEKQDKSELSDAALAQRSKALTLMGEIANTRGDLDGALRRYREAMAGTEEMVARDPGDGQRLFDHAQNFFWIGEIARAQGRLDQAEAAFREYGSLADQMVAADADNPAWRMEVASAAANLGILYMAERRYGQAQAQFAKSVVTIEKLIASDGRKRTYLETLSDMLAWLADSRGAQGELSDAISARRRQLSILAAILAPDPRDVIPRQRVVPARQALAGLYLATGETMAAIREAEAAVSIAQALMATEPDNKRWKNAAIGALFSASDAYLRARQLPQAEAALQSGCSLAKGLLAQDPKVMDWRARRRDCLRRQTELRLAEGRAAVAVESGRIAASYALTVHTVDAVEDRYAIARAKRLLGDALHAAGDIGAATREWREALASIDPPHSERPGEKAERAKLYERLGRRAEARSLAGSLKAMGYKA